MGKYKWRILPFTDGIWNITAVLATGATPVFGPWLYETMLSRACEAATPCTLVLYAIAVALLIADVWARPMYKARKSFWPMSQGRRNHLTETL